MTDAPRAESREPGDLASFGADLRDLRASLGNPTYETMARRAGLSLSLLSTVDKGRVLPSANALRGYLAALGQTAAVINQWIARRDELRLAMLSAPSEMRDSASDGGGAVDPSATESARPGTARTSRNRIRSPVVAAALVGAFTLIGGFALGRSTTFANTWWPASAPTDSAGARAPRIPASGDDPYVAGCLDDATPVAGTTQADGTVIHLMWSGTCSANWGRITLPQGATFSTATVTATVAPTGDDSRMQESTITGQQTVYTPIVIVDVTEQACAGGTWTVDGETATADDPACA